MAIVKVMIGFKSNDVAAARGCLAHDQCRP
jgi:hypothetical protein